MLQDSISWEGGREELPEYGTVALCACTHALDDAIYSILCSPDSFVVDVVVVAIVLSLRLCITVQQ